jgi:hypothetical protein
MVQSVKFTGGIGTVGVYVPQDPGDPDQLSQHGQAAFDFGCSGSRASGWALASAHMISLGRHQH